MIEAVAATLVLGLASYRLTLLLVEDRILAGPRLQLQNWLTITAARPTAGVPLVGRIRRGAASAVLEVSRCEQCLSVWASAALTALLWGWAGQGYPVAVFGATAGLSSFLLALSARGGHGG